MSAHENQLTMVVMRVKLISVCPSLLVLLQLPPPSPSPSLLSELGHFSALTSLQPNVPRLVGVTTSSGRSHEPDGDVPCADPLPNTGTSVLNLTASRKLQVSNTVECEAHPTLENLGKLPQNVYQPLVPGTFMLWPTRRNNEEKMTDRGHTLRERRFALRISVWQKN